MILVLCCVLLCCTCSISKALQSIVFKIVLYMIGSFYGVSLPQKSFNQQNEPQHPNNREPFCSNSNNNKQARHSHIMYDISCVFSIVAMLMLQKREMSLGADPRDLRRCLRGLPLCQGGAGWQIRSCWRLVSEMLL